MPSWWGKSSSKEVKKKPSKESFIDTLQQKFRFPVNVKFDGTSERSRRQFRDMVSEGGSQSRAESRSPSPKHVAQCQSFAKIPQAQPLPLPSFHPANVGRTDSGISISTKPRVEKSFKSTLFRPLQRPECIRNRPDPTELDGDLVTASVSSESSVDSDDMPDCHIRASQASACNNGMRTVAGNPYSMILKDSDSKVMQANSRKAQRPPNILLNNQNSSTSPRKGPLGNPVPSLQLPYLGTFFSAPDSSMSSPSRSPMRAFCNEQVMNTAFWGGKAYPVVNLLGSSHSSSPGSGQNSGHDSIGGDLPRQLFCQLSKGSPEYSPIPSPKMASSGPGSRVQSGAVTPVHPRSGGASTETHASWADDGRQQSHQLPLPPIRILNSSPFSHGNSAVTSPSVPRSPARTENPTSPASHWKKGNLLGRGTFGHVYVGFNSETGEMCAIKEVTLFSDDAKSKESAKQLGQEIALLSRLQHPNIVQYYGSEAVDDKLYVYLEYVSGGSIYKILQEYGKLGELLIRSYTQQILSGLAYLHAKNTVHRDIKGANILVDPNGRVKLADFGMAKHITGQSCPLSFKGSPYWMAPEVIKNSNGCNLAVDIWSLGCTVLEMATTKPPWSQYEGVAAIFKIGNSKELPAIPDQLSEEGKDLVRLCLQRNPHNRPTAAQLLDHPFVKNAAPLERPILSPEHADPLTGVTIGIKTLGVRVERNILSDDSGRLAVHSSRVSPTQPRSSEYHIPRKDMSCPVSPVGSPLEYPRSLQHLNRVMSPSSISSPPTTSGSSTPLTGGSYAMQFHHSQPSVHLQGGIGSKPKSPSVFLNGPTNHNLNTHIFQSMQSGSLAFRDLKSSKKETTLKQLRQPCHSDLHNRRTVFADRVSQQLLRDHVKLNPSLDFSPPSALPSHNH
ncbi:hypothetical protein Nepgr_010816 [Nepenthes gracilis]|uniref:mitogen-activated protein kinase kinase kinase n=1 Tax=Nepenthes gracilis TaxID=150966 RepID=A0AAD3SDW8_NEPGR|nr:hypothetical protein Nepgr_010816 [Nepenthes gracilis]